MRSIIFLTTLLTALPLSQLKGADFPDVPIPVENTMNSDKRVLGKILFWDEQLSVDNSVACGTCHQPEFGGADSRSARHPGIDGLFNTEDDIFGSPGVIARDNLGQPVFSSDFNNTAQVTNRAAPSYFMGIWATENFWDGRAGSEFLDPESGETLIDSGAGLENQALGPIMSSVEMGQENRQWSILIEKLRVSSPLALATNFPVDISDALQNNNSYPALFSAAFGSSEITAARIVMAIATHERTLISNQTPWDLAQANNSLLPGLENLGWEYFQDIGCSECHIPPLFTDNEFHNTGLRKANDDQGRMQISGLEEHRGDMKTPSLRNAALKKSFMHTGQFLTLAETFDSYADVPFIRMADKLPNGNDYDFNVTESQRSAILAFLENSLTDPRVAQNLYPFDRPRLRTEAESRFEPKPPTDFKALEEENGYIFLQWQPSELSSSSNSKIDYEIIRSDGLHAWTTNTQWIDNTSQAGHEYIYTIIARTNAFQASLPVEVTIKTRYSSKNIFYVIFSITMLLGMIFILIKKYIFKENTYLT